MNPIEYLRDLWVSKLRKQSIKNKDKLLLLKRNGLTALEQEVWFRYFNIKNGTLTYYKAKILVNKRGLRVFDNKA